MSFRLFMCGDAAGALAFFSLNLPIKKVIKYLELLSVHQEYGFAAAYIKTSKYYIRHLSKCKVVHVLIRELNLINTKDKLAPPKAASTVSCSGTSGPQ